MRSRVRPSATSGAWTGRCARILTALEALAGDKPAGDIKRMSGLTPPEWRLRIGDWRVRFSRAPETHTILILRVVPRGRAYRD